MPTAETVDPKVVERMKKLHEHAKSAKNIGSEAEAQTFMDKLQEMLAKHKMSLSDIDFEKESHEPCIDLYWKPKDNKIEVKAQSQAPRWLHQLARMCSSSNSCSYSGVNGTNWVLIHGKALDVERAQLTLTYLAQAAMRIAMRSYRTLLAEKRAECGNEVAAIFTKDYKSSFLLGFVLRIEKRIAESRTKLEQVAPVGLMRISQDLARAAKSLEEKHNLTMSLVKPENINGMAYAEGVRKANDQSIRPAGYL